MLLAEGLHDELLEITGEEKQAVLVGKHDHVLGAAAVRGEMPHQREEGGGILRGGRGARDDVHGGGAVEHGLDVEALEGGGQQADSAELGGAAADPVPHREAGEPALAQGGGVEFRAGAGDGDEVFRVVEAGGRKGGDGGEHAVAGLGGAAGLGDDDDEGLGELAAQAGEDVIEAVGIGVVEEGDGELVLARVAQCLADKLRAERGTADADHEQMLEFALGAGNGAGVDLGGEVLDRGERGGNLGGQFGGGRKLRGAEPVMADHALLVGVRDGAFFQRGHVRERLLDGGFLRREEVVRERDPADIERHTEVGVLVEVGLKAGPGHGNGK